MRPTVEIDNALNKTVWSFGSAFIDCKALSPGSTLAQRQEFLDSFLLTTRTLRPRIIRFGIRFDFWVVGQFRAKGVAFGAKATPFAAKTTKIRAVSAHTGANTTQITPIWSETGAISAQITLIWPEIGAVSAHITSKSAHTGVISAHTGAILAPFTLKVAAFRVNGVAFRANGHPAGTVGASFD